MGKTWDYLIGKSDTMPSQPAGGYSVTGSPSISAAFIDQILCKYSSPACGTGTDLYNIGVQYNIDPAFALAVFWNESNFGTSGMAKTTLSLGNLRCIQSAACVSGYASFSSWADGYRAFYSLASGPIYVGSGLTTAEQIIPKYAPAGDGNNTSAYISVVESCMNLWRSGTVAVQ
jgi:hypothetical protein